ncbi:IclR family transcriptional regulator domain-containing protein [Actinacidiphila oryziradicis]|uniref:IclR family transcriptional regulator n=1 Tax=Actinacidiphila oryziradicis TaxID=2571141 RepID=A0A4U0SR78_9ACTN|nr:IclR family transcriptional regulator C-terminal domain-containing protein [Actinacidiphila oryziradicis]TKA11908.1 IclR family transcriptional regulator [Actinacidiphila oryziradicis]
MAGLAKGLAVIETFGQSYSQLTVSEAARATGLSRATARRCLLTLTELGFLAHDGKHFRPTPRMVRLGGSYARTDPLPRLAQPILLSARQQLGESVSLAVFEDGAAVFVARAETERIVSAGVRVGIRLPACSSATGRVLLAALPDEELDAYLAGCRPEARTEKSLVDIEEISRRIVEARTQEVAFTDEELELGMRSMATPVKDSRGATRAALSVSAFTARIGLEDMRERFLPVLKEHADRIGRML